LKILLIALTLLVAVLCVTLFCLTSAGYELCVCVMDAAIAPESTQGRKARAWVVVGSLVLGVGGLLVSAILTFFKSLYALPEKHDQSLEKSVNSPERGKGMRTFFKVLTVLGVMLFCLGFAGCGLNVFVLAAGTAAEGAQEQEEVAMVGAVLMILGAGGLLGGALLTVFGFLGAWLAKND